MSYHNWLNSAQILYVEYMELSQRSIPIRCIAFDKNEKEKYDDILSQENALLVISTSVFAYFCWWRYSKYTASISSDRHLWKYHMDLIHWNAINIESDSVVLIHIARIFMDTNLMKLVQSTISRRVHVGRDVLDWHFQCLSM